MHEVEAKLNTQLEVEACRRPVSSDEVHHSAATRFRTSDVGRCPGLSGIKWIVAPVI